KEPWSACGEMRKRSCSSLGANSITSWSVMHWGSTPRGIQGPYPKIVARAFRHLEHRLQLETKSLDHANMHLQRLLAIAKDDEMVRLDAQVKAAIEQQQYEAKHKEATRLVQLARTAEQAQAKAMAWQYYRDASVILPSLPGISEKITTLEQQLSAA